MAGLDQIRWRYFPGTVIRIRERPSYMSEEAYARRLRRCRDALELERAARDAHAAYVPDPVTAATFRWLVAIVHDPRQERWERIDG